MRPPRTAWALSYPPLPTTNLLGCLVPMAEVEAIDLIEGKLRDAGFRLGLTPPVKFKPTDVTKTL